MTELATVNNLTVPQAAAYLGVTGKDILAYIHRGELPGVDQ